MAGGSNPPSATNSLPPDSSPGRALLEAAERLPIPRGVTIVLAVSGGPDSVALLHGAAAVAASRDWHLVVAHLDHGLRPDSAADADFVAAKADALALPWRLRRIDVAVAAASDRTGIEEAGRVARYAFLEEVAQDLGTSALVATAHTADDQAETVILNLARGSGMRGLRGMPARRGRLVRPFLQTRRGTLRAALDESGIGYRLDPTNADPAQSRARVRATILPALESLNPAAVEAVVRFAALAADDDALLDQLAGTELVRRRQPDGAIDWHDPPPAALGRRVLRLAIGDPAPGSDRIEALLDAASGPRGGLVIELGRGRTAEIRARRIVIGL